MVAARLAALNSQKCNSRSKTTIESPREAQQCAERRGTRAPSCVHLDGWKKSMLMRFRHARTPADGDQGPVQPSSFRYQLISYRSLLPAVTRKRSRRRNDVATKGENPTKRPPTPAEGQPRQQQQHLFDLKPMIMASIRLQQLWHRPGGHHCRHHL
jgi:hypothetical protein